MKAETVRAFPQWEDLYRAQAPETLPWFNPELDEDLMLALEGLGLRKGRLLDLGTGPGTQAMQLARRGFEVTATDVSVTAIRKARRRAEAKGLDITWKQDDVLHSGLVGPFDLIFDRGCFHVLPPERRKDYIATIARLLAPGGYLFLKCFSHRQLGEQGPYRFTPRQIRELFGDRLHLLSIHESVFKGNNKPLPRALFCVMRN